MNDAFQKSVDDFGRVLASLSAPPKAVSRYKRAVDFVVKTLVGVVVLVALLAVPVLFIGFVAHTLQGWF